MYAVIWIEVMLRVLYFNSAHLHQAKPIIGSSTPHESLLGTLQSREPCIQFVPYLASMCDHRSDQTAHNLDGVYLILLVVKAWLIKCFL